MLCKQRIQRDVLRTVIRLRYGSCDPYRSRGVVNRTVTDRNKMSNRSTNGTTVLRT